MNEHLYIYFILFAVILYMFSFLEAEALCVCSQIQMLLTILALDVHNAYKKKHSLAVLTLNGGITCKLLFYITCKFVISSSERQTKGKKSKDVLSLT